MHSDKNDFFWGASASAYQSEGGYDSEGKGNSIWDEFTKNKRKVKGGQNANVACDFYNRFEEDLDLLKSLSIPNFRFSLSWSRIIPDGKGKVNKKGIDFYKKLIDACLEREIEPWVTLYHWDLPQALENEGGWVNRESVNWFSDYVEICVKEFGDHIKYWMVMNEPVVFTGAGYFLGVHAPGRRGMKNYLPAVHHTALSQAAGIRIIKDKLPNAIVGTTFSCSLVQPLSDKIKDLGAANRVDALLNRMFVEPLLGRGYPVHEIPALKKIEKYYLPGDEERLIAPFDFIGIQNYTREFVKHCWWMPIIKAKIVPANKRKVFRTIMNWEVYPQGIFEMIKQFSAYPEINKIIVTENGAAFSDEVTIDGVIDNSRREYLMKYISEVLRARSFGYPVDGYFVWSFTDNFEWAEGFTPRFGIVHIDFETLKRTVKNSGIWYSNFIKEQMSGNAGLIGREALHNLPFASDFPRE